MTDLENIEQHLNIDTDGKRLREGKKKKNKNKYFYFRNQFYVVELTQDKWMIASDDDTTRRLLRDHVWYVHSRGYATTPIKVNGRYKTERFHRLVIGARDKGDHINRHTFDNRVTNLRDVTTRDNNRNKSTQRNNTSGKQGVCRDTIKGRQYFKVRICNNDGKRISKFFSIDKLGEEDAKRQAIQKRLELEQLYGYDGE